MLRAMSTTTALSASSSVTTPSNGAASSPVTMPVSAIDSAWTTAHSHSCLTMSGLVAFRAGYRSRVLTMAWPSPVAAGNSQITR